MGASRDFSADGAAPGASRITPQSVAAPAWLSDDDVPIALVFVMFATFACIIPPQADTFYHLRSGRAMMESGGMLDRELFSYTSYGRPLDNHWWLSQLAFYWLYSHGGPVLLTVAIGACGLLAVVMSYRLIRGGLETRLVLLLSLILILPQWSLRPQVFSMLFMMLVVRLVLAQRLPWVLPVLLVWANAHAMVIFGIAIVGLAAVDAVVWSRQRTTAAVLTAMAAAVIPLASPLGVHYWPRVLETVRLSRSLGIHEYRSAFAAGFDALGFWILFAALAAATLWKVRRPNELNRGDRLLLLIAGMLAVATLLSVRNGSFFALLAAPALSRIVPSAPSRRRPASMGGKVLVGTAVVLALGFVLYKWRGEGGRRGWQPMTPAAIEAVRTCPAPIYNAFGTGGFLMWFVPEQRVFVDGRVEAYPAAFLKRSRQADVAGDYRALFRDYGIRCAVVLKTSPMAAALGRDESMVRRFDDGTWIVFVPGS